MWSGRANAALVDEVADLPPGTVLDLGCGEGGDAIWLAQHGWRVTAVDVSETALDRARRRADVEGVAEQVDFQRHDLAVSFPAGSFDLVSAQFLQSPLELPTGELLRAAAEAVADGGTLLVVQHAAPPPWSGHDHQHAPDAFPDPSEVLDLIGLTAGGWEVLVCEIRDRTATGPEGHSGVLRDGVIRARRGIIGA